MKLRPQRLTAAEAEAKYPTAIAHVRELVAQAELVNAAIELAASLERPAQKTLALATARHRLNALKAAPAVAKGFGFITGLAEAEATIDRLEAEFEAAGYYSIAALMLEAAR